MLDLAFREGAGEEVYCFGMGIGVGGLRNRKGCSMSNGSRRGCWVGEAILRIPHREGILAVGRNTLWYYVVIVNGMCGGGDWSIAQVVNLGILSAIDWCVTETATVEKG